MQNTAQNAIAKLIAAVLDLRAGFPESELGESLPITVGRAMAHLPEDQWKDFGIEGRDLGVTLDDIRRLKDIDPPKEGGIRPAMIHGVVLADLKIQYDPATEAACIVNGEDVFIAEVPKFGTDFDTTDQGEIQTAIADALIKGISP